MALELPKAKNEKCWRSRMVVEISMRERLKVDRSLKRMSKRRIRGIFVARDWVIRKRVKRSWMVRIGTEID
jgi:hypothetical protein